MREPRVKRIETNSLDHSSIGTSSENGDRNQSGLKHLDRHCQFIGVNAVAELNAALSGLKLLLKCFSSRGLFVSR
jgi:hypothetical protein